MTNNENGKINTRKELVFLYSVRDSNPNGDMDDENRPRTDDEGYCLVSDVRLKRTIRDFLSSNGENILIRREYRNENDILNIEDLITKKFEELNKDITREAILDVVPKSFIDARMFGFVGAVKDHNASLTGSVQFAIGKSLNIPTISTHTITSVMSSGKKSGGSSIGKFHILDYALIRFEGVICPILAEKSGMTDKDLKKLYKAIWFGTQTLNTRSKVNHNPQLLLVVNSKNKEFLCGELAYTLELDDHNAKPEDMVIKLDKLLERLADFSDNIENVEYYQKAEITYSFTKKDGDKEMGKRFKELWDNAKKDKYSTLPVLKELKF